MSIDKNEKKFAIDFGNDIELQESREAVVSDGNTDGNPVGYADGNPVGYMDGD